jgi:uncharacterized protein
VFLTADGKPIFGGTYWPPDDKEIDGQKVRGFKSVLKLVAETYRDDPKEVQEQADRLAKATTDYLGRGTGGVALGELNEEAVVDATAEMAEQFDPVYGGFGNAARNFAGAKFPMPSSLGLLFTQGARTKSEELLGKVHRTLDRMARGGIYDHLGGGFHRYSTERTWLVPHFEKMLYDNAQLAELYARAYQGTPNPLYRRAITETLEFVLREMTSPDGGFYSALDADSEGHEGRFYVWTDAELNAALPDKAANELVRKVYGADDAVNFEEKYFILRLRRPLAEVAKEEGVTEPQLREKLAPSLAKLFAARAKRERPFLDTKVLTAWNGQMIAGFAAAGQVLKEPKYVAAAAKAADFVLAKLRTKDGRLMRTYSTTAEGKGEAKLNGYLDDYAFLTHGLLTLHDATGEPRWLDEAKALTEVMLKWHGDAERGGFFFTSHDHEKLFARTKDQYDGAQPSGNSVAASNLVRLWRKTGDARYRKWAKETLRAFAGGLKNNPTSLTAMASALAGYLDAEGKAPAATGGAEKPATTDSASKVKATAEAGKPDKDGNVTLTLTLDVEKGWHVYANPVDNDMFEAAATTVKVAAKGKDLKAKVEYPKGTAHEDKAVGEYKVYEGKLTIKATVPRGKDDGPLEVSIKVQSCDGMKCLLPGTVKLKVD